MSLLCVSLTGFLTSLNIPVTCLPLCLCSSVPSVQTALPPVTCSLTSFKSPSLLSRYLLPITLVFETISDLMTKCKKRIANLSPGLFGQITLKYLPLEVLQTRTFSYTTNMQLRDGKVNTGLLLLFTLH
jgi:hypothetical protein